MAFLSCVLGVNGLRHVAFGDGDITILQMESFLVRFSWPVEESNVLGMQFKGEQRE